MTSEQQLKKLLKENQPEEVVQEENAQFDDHLGAIIGQREDDPQSPSRRRR